MILKKGVFFVFFSRGVFRLTLGEVGGSRSLRGEMGRCKGLGRTLSVVESVDEGNGFRRLANDCCEYVKM